MPSLFTSEDVGDGVRRILEDKAKDEKDIVVSKLKRPIITSKYAILHC